MKFSNNTYEKVMKTVDEIRKGEYPLGMLRDTFAADILLNAARNYTFKVGDSYTEYLQGTVNTLKMWIGTEYIRDEMSEKVREYRLNMLSFAIIFAQNDLNDFCRGHHPDYILRVCDKPQALKCL